MAGLGFMDLGLTLGGLDGAGVSTLPPPPAWANIDNEQIATARVTATVPRAVSSLFLIHHLRVGG
jgi:hypothetical protein